MVNDKRKYVTCDQKSILIDFIKTNIKMIQPKCEGTFNIKECNKLWEQLAITLNALEGAKKSASGWRKCWHDLRRNTKEKVAKLRQHCKYDGGIPLQEDLTPIQEKVRALIEGHENNQVEQETKHFNFFNFEEYNNIELPSGIKKEVDNSEIRNVAVATKSANVVPRKRAKFSTSLTVKQSIKYKKKHISIAEKKLNIKKDYYNRKLSLLERHIQAINHQTEAINKQTVVHERLMQLLTRK